MWHSRQTDRQREASEKERVKQKTLLSFCWANSRHVASRSMRDASDINHGPSKCINCVLNDGVNGQRNYVSAQSLTSYQLSSHPACLPLPRPVLHSVLCPLWYLSHSRSFYLSVLLANNIRALLATSSATRNVGNCNWIRCVAHYVYATCDSK